MNLSPLPEYLHAARRVASRHGTNSIWAMFRLLYCRLRHGFGVRDFCEFGFYSLPWSAPEKYIDTAGLNALQNLLNSSEARELVDDKFKFLQRCQEHGLPTPAILGLVGSNKSGDSIEGIPFISSPGQLLEAVRLGGDGKYLLKPLRGSRGQGITRFELKGDRLIADSGEKFEIETLCSDPQDKKSLYILQKYLYPHAELRPLMPNACLGTARIHTVKTDGEPRVFLACQKIPTGDNATDNYHFGQTGNLIGEVDITTGCLLTPIGPDPDYREFVVEFSVHPDNGQPLPGFQIPCWADLLETAINGAKAFHELGTVGWDVALTEDGPCLIEGNSHYGDEQAVVRRGQKHEYEQLLNIRMQ